MNLNFDLIKSAGYTNKSQIARVLTESWLHSNIYCPNCGESHLNHFKNNQPVADFYCSSCTEQFELKSKAAKKVGHKIVDGAYSTMINRIQSKANPNFFFLTYDKTQLAVNNLLIIPKHYFTPSMIEKRNPLKITARRAGWVGCNISLSQIPENGRVFLIQNSKLINKENVLRKWQSTTFLNSQSDEARGWTLDILICLDAIQSDTFSLNDMYTFEKDLKAKHPKNNFIKDKIRQQLQLLRDKGIIEFKNRGIYKKVTS